MNKLINLSESKLLKEKICLLITECEYDYVIKNGLKLLNNENMNINDKITICFKMAFSYKQNNNLEQAIVMIDKGIEYYNKLKNKTCKDYYYRMIWLKNNCLKDLGRVDLEKALKDFEDMKSYYESIGEFRGVYMIGFTYGYWKKDLDIMLHYFKNMVKSNPVVTNIEINHNSNKACEDALLEIKELDIKYYEIAKKYMNSYIKKCI